MLVELSVLVPHECFLRQLYKVLSKRRYKNDDVSYDVVFGSLERKTLATLEV